MISAKYAIWLLVALVVVFGFIGIWTWEQPDYECYPSSSEVTEFRDKVEIVSYGKLHVYAYPLVKDCPSDNRYNANDVVPCPAGQCSNYRTKDGFDL